MAKEDFTIRLVDKKDCNDILMTFHYLKDYSKGFKSGYNFGLYCEEQLVGVCIYTGFPVPELVKGMFGLDRKDQEGFFELSRLCLTPTVQEQEYNITSWFVSKTIRELKKITKVRAILSYADSDFHGGTIYRACNFQYYGLSEKKKDFWIEQEDGSFKKHTRGKVKGLDGEWRDRSQKHRFLLVFDKKLKILWKRVDYCFK